MSDMLTDIGRTPERPLRSATVLSVSNGRAKIELATGSVIPDALLVGGVSVGQSVRVAYQGGQYIVYGSAAEVAPSVSVAGTISGGTSAGGAPTPHDWLGIHHTLPSGAAGLFAATPSGSSGTVSMRGIVLSDIQAAADSRYSLASRTITAGAGLTGGGDLTGSRTLNVGQGDGIAVDADAVRVRRATTSGLSFSSGGLAVGAGNGISVLTDTVAVNQAYAFTWSAAHTFSANATFSAGLTATRLTGSSNVLELANATSFQSVSFNAGFAGDGWRITRPSGASTKASFETDNLTVRGSMRVYELLINQVRATNGSVLVSSTGKVATATYVSGTGGMPGNTFNFSSDDDTAHGFLANDIIMAKRATGTNPFTVVMRVASSPAPTATTWQGVLLYNDGSYPVSSTSYVGLEFVRIGNTTNIDRQGSVYLSADDSGAPFVQVSDGVAAWADWNAAGKVRVKFGNLNGSYGYATNTYGFAAGNSATTFVSADATNGFRVRNGSVNRFTVDLSGNVALRDASGTQRVGLTSAGVVEIDDSNGQARVLIDSGGLKLRDSSGNAAITLDASGNSQFTGVMTIASTGEIRQGTGSLTASPATYTGLRIWSETSGGNLFGRIGGYNGGTLQWYAGTDGKLYAGNGDVIIDSSGISIDASGYGAYGTNNSITWKSQNSSGNLVSSLYMTSYDGGNRYFSEIRSAGFTRSNPFQENVLRLWAESNSTSDGSLWPKIDIIGRLDTLSESKIKLRASVVVFESSYNLEPTSVFIRGGLQFRGSGSTVESSLLPDGFIGTFGSIGVGPNAFSDFSLEEGDAKFEGGLNVGSATGAGTGDVRASGGIALNGGALGEAALHSVAPVNQFPASSGSAYEAALRVRGSAGGVLSSIVLDISASGAAGAQGGWLQARTSSNYGTFHQLLLNPNGGNVGVGVTSTTSRLHVGGDVNSTGVYRVSATQVVGTRKTGWAAATGTATRTAFATGTVTTAQLAERVKALVDDLISHGLIGA